MYKMYNLKYIGLY